MLLTNVLRVILTRSLKPFIFEGNYANKLDFEDLKDLGLYVHIPFCRSLCSFCPYCKEEYNQPRSEAYKAALLKEIDLVCASLPAQKEATSLYFGGGTPALMIDDLKDIIERLKQYFNITGGVGVELHPLDITPLNLQKLRSSGVNMVSLGIQSFNVDCLRKIGRNEERFKERIRLASTQGFEVVDVDLIFAIPGQTSEILRHDLETAFSCGATQVSTYPFIDFTFADNKYKPMGERIKKHMLEDLVQFAASTGIERTSVWTFAKPGSSKYSSVTRDAFLGFGVSATTLLKDIFKINTFSIDGYIERLNANCLPTSLTLNFSPRQRAAYYLFWSAYAMQIEPAEFENIIGKPLREMFGVELYWAEKLGFMNKRGSTYVLSNRAANIYHHVEQVYTTAYIDKMWNVSRNIAFPDRIKLW
ncbi:MAG: radical SAM protein [Syntrophomonadaceae bacterium]